MSMADKKLKIMIEIALIVALSYVFAQLRLFRMPQGGSVTLTMVPLVVLALRRGAGPAVAAGAILGTLRLMDGYVLHFAQLLLDYPLPFALVGLAGLFPGHPFYGILLAGAARYSCHVISGAVFFAAYAPEAMNPWIYSLGYNASFLVPELILTAVLVRILWTRKDLFYAQT